MPATSILMQIGDWFGENISSPIDLQLIKDGDVGNTVYLLRLLIFLQTIRKKYAKKQFPSHPYL